MKQEIVVGIRTGNARGETTLAYTIDLSRDGMKIGSPALYLAVGDPVELLFDRPEGKVFFSGKVSRNDGIHYIDRIRRSGNAFVIRIEDAEYTKFVAENFFVY